MTGNSKICGDPSVSDTYLFDVQGRTNVAGGMMPLATKDKGSEIYLKS